MLTYTYIIFLFLYNIQVFELICIFLVSSIISSLLVIISIIFYKKNYDLEKLISYECGFNSFGVIRQSHDINFFKLVILFLIFDIEIIIFFPLSVKIFLLNSISFLYLVLALFILVIGFVYEWKTEFIEI